ncbi:iron chaperone [Flexivirga sp. B27]
MTASTSTRTERSTPGDGENFSAEERAAIKERARETRAARKRTSAAQKAAESEQAVVARIDELPGHDRDLARRVHAIVTRSAPQLAPKLWYGMPAYALDGTIVCFFQHAAKFKARYATLGFSDAAQLDDGTMWPASFAITEITDEVERQIETLVLRALR